MKKYKVSLGVLVTANWEIDVEAESEKEAIEIARKTFTSGCKGQATGAFTDPDYDEVQLLGDKAVYVEEEEEDDFFHKTGIYP